jgi:ssDNA-binding Zn-finger/Zn-ribbon topoisomerase 1
MATNGTDENLKTPLNKSNVEGRVMRDPYSFNQQYMQKPIPQETCPKCDQPLIERNSPRKGTLFICKACRWTSA